MVLGHFQGYFEGASHPKPGCDDPESLTCRVNGFFKLVESRAECGPSVK